MYCHSLWRRRREEGRGGGEEGRRGREPNNMVRRGESY